MVLDIVLWSIQMWVAFSIWIASPPGTPRICMFWMMTLAGLMSSMLSVVPDTPEFEPTPRIVLLAETSIVPEPLSMPLTRIVRVPAACAWVRRSAHVDTVTVAPPAPPVVPPAWVAQPTIPVGGFGFWLWLWLGDGCCDDGVPGELGGWLGPGPAASVTTTSSKAPAV
jgi:hypothetical protein